MLHETIKLHNLIAKELSKNFDVCTKILINDGQYVKSNTNLSRIEILNKQYRILVANKINNRGLNSLLFLENKDIKKVFFNKITDQVKVSVGDLIRVGTRLTTNKYSPHSGQVYKLNRNEISIRIGEPYLISENTILNCTFVVILDCFTNHEISIHISIYTFLG